MQTGLISLKSLLLSKQTNQKVMRTLRSRPDRSIEADSVNDSNSQLFFDIPASSEAMKKNNQPVVAVKRKLGVKFQNTIKDAFSNDKQELTHIMQAFRAALAKPLKTESISMHNPLHKEGQTPSGWTFREVEKEIAANRFIFATNDEVSCD